MYKCSVLARGWLYGRVTKALLRRDLRCGVYRDEYLGCHRARWNARCTFSAGRRALDYAVCADARVMKELAFAELVSYELLADCLRDCGDSLQGCDWQPGVGLCLDLVC